MSGFEFVLPAEVRRAESLPSPPGVVMEVLRLINDDRSTVDDLAAVIDHDPVLAAKLLKTVNSSLYGLQRAIRDVSNAAALLGFRSVRSLALGVAVAESFPARAECAGFDLDTFWRRSLLTAVTARCFAMRVKRNLAEDAFTSGLLANLGKLVLAHCLPERYAPVVATSPWPDPVTEKQMLGYTSTTVTASLLSHWDLPDSLCLSIGFIHNPTSLPSRVDYQTELLVAICAVAEVAVGELVREDGEGTTEEVVAQASPELELDVETVRCVFAEALEQIVEAEHLVSSDLPSGLSPAALVSQAQQLLSRLASAPQPV